MSISTDQLGFSKGEALPPPVLQPPPKYPPLEHKAWPPVITTEMSYLLELKREFAEYMRESPNNVLPLVVKKDIERYSDRYQDLITDKSSYETRCDWSRMPAELKPQLKKRQKGQSTSTLPLKKRKAVDVETKLQELEKKETSQPSDAEEEEKEEEDAEEKDDEHAEDEEEELDEEMDEGTDYVNNYFDNGEGYDDEDDNLDDGPIY